MAATVLTSVPTAILLMAAQKRIVAEVTAGAIKD